MELFPIRYTKIMHFLKRVQTLLTCIVQNQPFIVRKQGFRV